MGGQNIKAQDTTPAFPVAIVLSQFNEPVTSKLLEGALERLAEREVDENLIDVVTVPGAVEIPLVAKRLAASNRYKAIVTLGAVIRGETSHYDFVCKYVTEGCLQIGMEFDLPVIFGVLTTDNSEQAFDRVGGKKGHRGRDAVDAAFEMVSILRQL